MAGMDEDRTVCESFQRAAQLVAKRWTPQIVWVLLDGRRRYSAVRDAIPEISDTLLSERLRDLEEAGIVTRTVTPSTPVLIEYGLSERGRELAVVMDGLSTWAERWAAVGASPSIRRTRHDPRSRALRR
jgi:DNA-binding HxlR family transcriptional regulator